MYSFGESIGQQVPDWANNRLNTKPLWLVTSPKHSLKTLKATIMPYGVIIEGNASAVPFSYSSYLSLINEITDEDKTRIKDKIESGRFKDIAHLILREKPYKPTKLSFAAERVHQAVVRRISRESAYNARIIDQATRFLIEMITSARLNKTNNLTFVILRDFDFMDRPSIRIFYRAYQLCKESDKIKWIWMFNHAWWIKTSKRKFEDLPAITQTRINLINRLREYIDPKIIYADGSSSDQPRNIFRRPRVDSDNTHYHIAQGLVDQNYELCILLATEAIRITKDPEHKAEMKRLLALVTANVGINNQAVKLLRESLHLAKEPIARAHLHYLLGLVYNKRFYDLETAEREYNEGLSELDRVPSEVTSNLERAWLMNGISFVNALRAKRQSREESTKLLHGVLRTEINAYNLVDGPTDTQHIYLRFNLLANIAFIFEILKDYEGAIKFWQNTFSPYLDGTYGPEYDKILGYRLGLLFFRANNIEEALKALYKALAGAQAEKDEFLEERILYAIGYVYANSHDDQRALEIFRKGINLTIKLRDWDMLPNYLFGLASAGGALNEVSTLRQYLETVPGPIRNSILPLINKIENEVAVPASSSNPTRMHKQLILPPLSPKLPSYIASVDLEPVPLADVNQFLISQDSSIQDVIIKNAGREDSI